mgnify:CR=1 FL=1
MNESGPTRRATWPKVVAWVAVGVLAGAALVVYLIVRLAMSID